jgi:hypothetical protein
LGALAYESRNRVLAGWGRMALGNLKLTTAQGEVGPQHGQSCQSSCQEGAAMHDLILALSEKFQGSILNGT